MFSEINEISQNFSNLLNKVDNFNITKDILKDFKKINNYKSIIISMLALSIYSGNINAVELNTNSLQSMILSSKIENIEYKKNNFLILNKEILSKIKFNKSTIVENPFFHKNIVYITKDKSNFKLNSKSAATLSNGSSYKINSIEGQQNNIINGIDKYKHIVYINDIQFEIFKRDFKNENKDHVYPLFLLHELAHSSFEQGSFSYINPHYKKFGVIQSEIHSDVSAIIMYSKLNDFNKKQTISLLDDLIVFRLNNTIYNNDWTHDSTLALFQLKNNIEKGEILISEFNLNEISPYAADLTEKTFNRNYSKELSEIFKKENIAFKNSDLVVSFSELRDNLKKLKKLNNEQKYLLDLSKLLIKKDISKMNDTEIIKVAGLISKQFENVNTALFSYFSKYYKEGYIDLLRLNDKKELKISLNI